MTKTRNLAVARAKNRAHRRNLSLANTILVFHDRWESLLDTSLKLIGFAWIVMSFLSSYFLNEYFSTIGQTGLPLDHSGTWAIVALLGGVLIVTLSTLGFAFAGAHPIMAALHGGKPISLWTRGGFCGATIVSVLGMLLLLFFNVSVWLAICIPVATGLGIGVFIFRIGNVSFLRDGYYRPAGWLFLWVIVAPFLFVWTATNLETVLRIRLSGNEPLVIAIAVAVLQIIGCSLLPKGWIVAGMFVFMTVLVMVISPGPQAIVLASLYNFNLGGGVPATALSNPQAAWTCNLGTADRPVLYRSKIGCTKEAALEHLRRLSDTDDIARRAEIIGCWRRTADRPGSRCERDGLDH